jgi:hypothetical protein
MKSLIGGSVTEVKAPTGDPTKLGNVISEPTKPCTWNKDTEIMPGYGLRGRGSGSKVRLYLSSMGMSEKWSSSACLIGL